jgi:hypothetical protein
MLASLTRRVAGIERSSGINSSKAKEFLVMGIVKGVFVTGRGWKD